MSFNLKHATIFVLAIAAVGVVVGGLLFIIKFKFDDKGAYSGWQFINLNLGTKETPYSPETMYPLEIELIIPSVNIKFLDSKRLKRLWLDIDVGKIKTIDESQIPTKIHFTDSPPEILKIIIVDSPALSLNEEPTEGRAYLADGYAIKREGNKLIIEISGPGLDYSQPKNIQKLNSTVNMRLVKVALYVQKINEGRTLEWRDKVIQEYRSYQNPNEWLIKLEKK